MADLVLLLILLLFSFWGFKRGFVKTILGLTSTVLSLFLTSFLYSPIASFIYELGVGDAIKNMLLSGAENADTALAKITSMLIVNIITFLLIIIIIKILLSILVNSLNLITKLPLIKQVNSLLGLCSGFATGLLISYIAIGIVATLSGNDFVTSVLQHIRNSNIAVIMYDNNIITNILSEII